MQNLTDQSCQRKAVLLSNDETRQLAKNIHSDWVVNSDASSISRTFTFSNYYETVAFINAAIQVAHKQDHHPDICFGYKQCEISYSTHSVGGLSLNDFICAAKVDRLLD